MDIWPGGVLSAKVEINSFFFFFGGVGWEIGWKRKENFNSLLEFWLLSSEWKIRGELIIKMVSYLRHFQFHFSIELQKKKH